MKNRNWDLHFEAKCVRALTPAGRKFLTSVTGSLNGLYYAAITEGLHVSFESDKVRNQYNEETLTSQGR